MSEKSLEKFTAMDASAMAIALGMVANNKAVSADSSKNDKHGGACLILPSGTYDKIVDTSLTLIG
jgi:hypothetical protein